MQDLAFGVLPGSRLSGEPLCNSCGEYCDVALEPPANDAECSQHAEKSENKLAVGIH